MPRPHLRKSGSAFLLALLCLLGVGPASANLVVEPSFAQKMERADLVLIGTVTAVDRGGRGGRGSSAVLRSCKG
jgi:hypothetical protein